ncbi:MAG: nuclear transport factor 2 family protein [Myxococcales bacterium]|nr:nuclear transport factor 2 family protein [Myxococcales bacterium]
MRAASLFLALLASACGRATTPGPALRCAAPLSSALSVQDRAAVEAVLTAQAAAWNRGDLEGYMQGYARSDALVFTSGSKVRTGFDETLASYRKKYGSDRSSMGSLTFTLQRVDPVGASGAVVLGRWDLQLASGPAGGVFSVVLERRAEGWRIIHDHTSADPVASAP